MRDHWYLQIDWPREVIYFELMMTNIRNLQTKILSRDWSVLKRMTYEYLKTDGAWETQTREVYDRGNGAAILLYHPLKKTVILTKQFRIPTYLNGNEDGMMIEACAGKLEDENPDKCIKREVKEETGYALKDVTKIFEAYMSPGSVTELIHFYIAPYTDDMKIHDGGGVESEQENIQVLEISFKEALSLINKEEIKDAKTIMLLQYALINRLLEPEEK